MSAIRTLDGFATGDELAEVAASWPADDWPGWVRYGGPQEGKRASDASTPLPYFCARLLARMASCCPAHHLLGIYRSVPDLSLWGGGLHEMAPGSELPPHLDADGHPRLGLLRAWSAVLYVHEVWRPGDGGELVLLGKGGRSVTPVPGRLVAFDCRDRWHAVTKTLVARRSLALFGYLPDPAGGERPRAEFAGR